MENNKDTMFESVSRGCFFALCLLYRVGTAGLLETQRCPWFVPMHTLSVDLSLTA